MSMLTPPGMGGKYKITGNAYPRMRRPPKRRRRILAAVASLVVLSVIGWGTLELVDVFGGHHEANAAAGEKCRKSAAAPDRAAKALPRASTITVNVYNATSRSQLAKHTADQLKKRGFRIGKVDDAPARYDKKVDESALLLAGPRGSAALSVVGAHFSGERTSTDQRKDDSVDVMIGKSYKQLEPPKAATSTLAALAKPAPALTPSSCH